MQADPFSAPSLSIEHINLFAPSSRMLPTAMQQGKQAVKR
jgi:hypothetical protein